jgi:hypothetical protein
MTPRRRLLLELLHGVAPFHDARLSDRYPGRSSSESGAHAGKNGTIVKIRLLGIDPGESEWRAVGCHEAEDQEFVITRGSVQEKPRLGLRSLLDWM